jgi:DNA polymerase-1
MGSASKLLLVDGHALIYRAYHALPKTLSTSRGEPTNASFGFTQMLLEALRREEPEYAAVAFDVGRTFRHDEFEAYKAHRPGMPDDLSVQIRRVRQVVEALGLAIYEVPGFEADDVIGTLTLQALSLGLQVAIVTGDTDTLQLIRPGVVVITPGPRSFSEPKVYDLQAVVERYGFPPERLPDFKALVGDVSDNIPGVKGIGEKTARELIVRFGTVEEICGHLEEIEPIRLRAALREGCNQALVSKRLATIVTNVPTELDLDRLRWRSYLDRERVLELFRELEFRKLVGQIPQEPSAVAVVEPSTLALAWELVRGKDQLERVVRRLQGAKQVALDTETTGQNAMLADLLGIALATRPNEAYYISISAVGDYPGLSLSEVVELLSPLFSGPDVAKVAHNGKFDIMVLSRHGLKVDNLVFDTMIAAYLLGETSVRLKDLAFTRLNLQVPGLEDIAGTTRGKVDVRGLDVETLARYSCTDVAVTLALMEQLQPELERMGLMDLFRTVEMPLVPVLADMEMTGVCIDVGRLQRLSRQLFQQLKDIEAEIFRVVGHEFNINSPQQLSRVLFQELGLKGRKRTQTGYSTSVQVLEALRGSHPVVDLVLEYRQIAKIKSTYVDALPGLVHPQTGRVHTSFNQAVVATGRLSSSEPNLQNIPVRSELGKEVRRAFVAGNRPECRLWDERAFLLSADYSQIELRILAHVTEDPNLMEAFAQDLDIHAATASRIFGVPLDQVTPGMRRLAKVVNFGIVYGLSPYGLSERAQIPTDDAKKFIQDYLATYPKVREYVEEIVKTARQQGYVTTLLGRRRYLPELNSPNGDVRAAAERMAINMPIQGTAADIMKLAMIRLNSELKERGLRTRLLLQVHDELLLEVPESELAVVRPLVQRSMEGAYPLKVPLKVELVVGENWGDMVEWEAVPMEEGL